MDDFTEVLRICSFMDSICYDSLSVTGIGPWLKECLPLNVWKSGLFSSLH